MLPEFSSIVVATTAVFEASNCAHAGSLGCVPLSSITSHTGSDGMDDPSGIVIIRGSSELMSTTDTISSGLPSSSKSARSGWVTER